MGEASPVQEPLAAPVSCSRAVLATCVHSPRLRHPRCIQSHQELVQITERLQHMGEAGLVGLT